MVTIPPKFRIAWIDMAKVIGIYLVTIAHGQLIEEEYRHLIFTFHMPFFFFISGMLYKHRSFLETIRKSYKSIVIPYLLISFVCCIYSLLPYFIHGNISFHDVWIRVGAILMGIGYNAGGWEPVSTPMWFVISLLIIYLMMSISRWKYWNISLLFISLGGGIVLQILNLDTYIPIDSSMMAMPFFIVGIKCNAWLNNSKSYYYIPILFSPIWYLIARNNGIVDMNYCLYGKNLILFYICGFSGALGLLGLIRLIPQKICELGG